MTVKEFTHLVQFLPKEGEIIDNDAFLLFTAGKIVSIYAFSVCKILSPENRVV